MNVNPWVIPGSLQNLPPANGKIPGFHFVFRARNDTYLYTTHLMKLSADGMDASSNLRLNWQGRTARAADLPETDWVARMGQFIEVVAEFPGGLKPGSHHIKLEVISGGYGGDGALYALCEFEDDLI